MVSNEWVYEGGAGEEDESGGLKEVKEGFDEVKDKMKPRSKEVKR